MRFNYKAFVIDASSDFSLGCYFAKARITRGPMRDEIEGETIEQSDLGHFQTEDAAVQNVSRFQASGLRQLAADVRRRGAPGPQLIAVPPPKRALRASA